MQANGIGQIDQPQFGIEEGDFLTVPLNLELGRFPAQERHDHADVFGHFR